METRLVKMDEVCEITSSKRIFAKEYLESGIPFYRGKEVTEKYKGNLNVTTELFISEEKYEEIKAKHGVPVTGDMLLTSVGTLGSTYVVRSTDKFYFKDGNLTWFRNFKGLNSRYLQYWLESPDGKGELKKSVIGSSQSAYTIANLKQMQMELPSEEKQGEIVSVIEAYDNLIENNNRRIAILEEMAQSLYREWFVKFRFPGHDQSAGEPIGSAASDPEGASATDGASQNAKFIESPLGKIPEGWEVMAASAAIQINPRTKLPKEGEKPFVPMGGLNESSMVIGDIELKAGNSGAKFINGDTLFSRITPCLQNGKIGYVQFLEEEQPVGFGSTEFIVLRATEHVCSEYVYLVSRTSEFRENAIKSMTGATGRQRVSNSCFDSYMLAVPQSVIMEEFRGVVKGMFDEIFNLSNRNSNLRAQRDLLLPRLMAGKINVAE